MASRSLGTLTLDLIAKIGAFTGPLDKASQEAKKRNAEISKSFDSLAKGVGTAIGSIPAVLTALVVHSASVAKEIANQASLAGLGTTEFQKYAAAAKSVGVEQDKLSDIFKDTNDKMGDFASTGGGELKDFFTNIAPKVGLTAESFKKLNSKDALALYVTSLEKANVSQQEMTFYMEAIANDSTALVPLLRNNGKAFDELGQAAFDAGVVMDEKTIAAAKQFGIELQGLGQYITSGKTMLAAEFLPVLAQFAKDVNQSAKEAGGLSGAVGDLGNKLVETSAFVVSAGDGVVRVFDILGNTLVGLYATAVAHMSSLMSSLASGLASVTIGDTADEFIADSARLRDEASINFSIAAQAAESINESLTAPLAGDKFKDYVQNAKKAAAEVAAATKTVTPGTGSGVDPAALEKAKKAAQDAVAAAKKINETFKSSETDLQRQIALINTSTDAQKKATEVDKLRFEIATGKLVGINAEQQKRLESLAAELDILEKLKVANEEEAKSSTYLANLRSTNATVKSGFDSELAGAGMGDKARDRLRLDLAIQQDFNEQMADLQKQLNAGDITPQLYAKETNMLQDALSERMNLQQDYYSRLDEAQGDWMSGVSDAWNNYRDEAADSAGQAKELFSSALSGTEDAIVDFVKTGKLSFKDLANSIIEDLIRIQVRQAAVGLLSSAFGAVTGGSQSLGEGTMTGFSEGAMVANAKGGVYDSPSLSSFSGGVYNSPQSFAFAKGAGIFAEAGPEAIMPLTRAADGSLGVRAVGAAGSPTAEASVNSTGSLGGVTQYITVQGSADDATLARIEQAARKGAQDGYNLVLRDLKQNGPARQLIARNR